MKRRTRRTYPAEPGQEPRGLSCAADRKRASSTSRLDIFTRTTITGLSFLKRSLKAFWPEGEKVILRCDRDLKRILMWLGNASGFLLFFFSSRIAHVICLCRKYSVYKLRKNRGVFVIYRYKYFETAAFAEFCSLISHSWIRIETRVYIFHLSS